MKIVKRDGRQVDFNKQRIINAIESAMKNTNKGVNNELSQKIANEIARAIKDGSTVEQISDMVEVKLMSSSRKDVAKEFVIYRNQRTEIRENNSTLMKLYDSIVDLDNRDLMQENANVDGESPMGQMGKIGFESAKMFAYKRMLSPQARESVERNLIHIHDLDFMPTGTSTCCQIPLGKLLKTGFNTGHGHMRTPQSIGSASALAAIILQANQNMQHGGQSLPSFDHDLAPYVVKSYEKQLRELEALPLDVTEESIKKIAWEKTEREAEQAMEAFVHNMNSMNSRSAGQVPFTSVNYGTDTSREGRLITKSILLATEQGLGKGETPIFPIQIFKVKEGINYNPEDPNYDLLELACRVTSKRLFPNFAFQDASYNLEYYVENDPESEIAYMGCRTRVLANVNGREIVEGRGNLSFTTVNLVKIALLADRNIDKFYKLLDEQIVVVKNQLLERYKFQISKQAKNFKFLMGEGVWMDSEKLSKDDTLENVLKHGSLSMGFIGLAEALVALTGEHHGESEDSFKLGHEIISHMRAEMDRYAKEYKLNFTLLATPSEGTAGKYVIKDREEFGNIKGVTNRDYYTNSFHIPVYYNIGVSDKIEIEGQFHGLCNAGHITYVELDGNASKNPEAIMQIVRTMKESEIGYGSINHPVDRCPICGFGGIIGNKCPECRVRESDGVQFERIRRITGYLVGTMDRWNSAKKAEEKDRVKHGQN